MIRTMARSRSPHWLAGCRRAVFAAFLAVFLIPARPGLQAAPAPDRFRPDRLLIKPGPEEKAANLARFHAAQGARPIRQFPQIERIQVLQLPPGTDVPALVRRYQQSGLVEFAEPDYAVDLVGAPNDPSFLDGSLWHLQNDGQSGGTPGADIGAVDAWNTLSTASNVIVAVVDSGIRYTHQDLRPNMWVNPGEIPGNGVDDDGDGFVDDVYGINAAANNGNPIDVLSHGTQVAGLIGAVGNNGLGVVGVAWRVRLMACRFFDDAGNGFLSDAVQAIDYARAKGAHIINASFVSTANSSALSSAINSCRAAGIIFVAAAGNDTQDNDVTPHYPASYNLDNIVAVAATTRNDLLAGFSDFGATSVDLAAPGEALLTTYNSADDAYKWNSGTSFSAPITAGAFALMRARYPSETYRQLIDRVLAAVDPLPSLTGRCVTGGRLNLARALGPSLQASFTASALAGLVPFLVRFTNTSFGTLTNVRWDFGDGTTSAEGNPTHVYTHPGTFTATLSVISSGGLCSEATRTVSAVSGYRMTNAVFAWIDPAGLPSLGLTGNGVSAALPLPFPFSFYGGTYTSVYIGANGLMGFESGGLSAAANTDLPNAALPRNSICPFWDDLSPASSAVRWGSVGTAPNRLLVAAWVGVTGGSGPSVAFTFEVVLEETSNRILFQYLEVQPASHNSSAAGKSATIGLEHASGLVATKYSFNGTALLANRQAIEFLPLNPPMAVTLLNPDLASGGLRFSFATESGRGYAAQFTAVLDSTNWQTFTNFSGNGVTAVVADPGPRVTRRFYRVRAQ